MKISLNEIRKYVDLPDKIDSKKLSYDLTMKTVEVEEVIDFHEKYKNIVVGKITKIEKHPNADALSICMVDVGKGTYQIICGGTNLYVGQKVVVALPGSMVVWHGEGEPVEIKETKLRGIDSYGMICASDEVDFNEIKKTQGHEIIDLKDYDVKPGDKISEKFFGNDLVIDIDNKSLTNRPDLWSHYGMAREIAAIYNLYLKPIVDEGKLKKIDEVKKDDNFKIEIKDEKIANRTYALKIKNVKNIESTLELKRFLSSIGEKSNGLLVDLSNYIMYLTGQPIHMYDANKIAGKIKIDSYKNNKDLDSKYINIAEEEMILLDDDIIVRDDEKVLALGGLIGGYSSSVDNNTTEIIVEIANFNSYIVRKMAQNHNLRTEASIRFEKNIDIKRMDQALSVLVQEIKKHFVDSEIVFLAQDITGKGKELLEKENRIKVSHEFLEKRMGRKISKKEIEEYLSKLGFKVEQESKNISEQILYDIYVPSWRSTGDISLKDDILEEIARMIGYENFNAIEQKVDLNPPIIQKEHILSRNIKEYLAKNCNMHEVIVHPFIEEKYINCIDKNSDNRIELLDPPSYEQRYLRTSLVQGLLNVVITNLKNYDEFKVFEMGKIFKKEQTEQGKLKPVEEKHLAGMVVGRDVKEIFLEVKGILENLERAVQINEIQLRQIKRPEYLEERAYFNILTRGKIIGEMGLLSKKTMVDAGIKNTYVCVFELNQELLIPNRSRENKFEKIPVFPYAKIDLSIIVDKNIMWQEIKKIALKTANKVDFVSVYEGKQIPEGKKSLTMHLEFASPDKTLDDKEIKEKTQKIIQDLEKKFMIEIRM